MLPKTITVGPLASASPNNIALSQSLAGAGSLTINGSLASNGIATLDTPRRVLITSAGNDSGLIWTLTGTAKSGIFISEIFNGGNAAAVYSALDYLTVTKISSSQATASTVTVGTNGIASSPWFRFDEWALPNATAHSEVTGTVNYTVQGTNDDPNSQSFPVSPWLVNWNDYLLGTANNTADQYLVITQVPIWMRVLLNSGSGSVKTTIAQMGSVPY